MARVLVLGGYGNFGKRICRYLAQEGMDVIIAGRNLKKAHALQKQIQQSMPQARIDIAMLSINSSDFVENLKELEPNIVVHTAGPFQGMGYQVPEACIKLGIHYVDISDARSYVVNISSLDEAAKEHNVVVVSGASSVPGFSSVVIDYFANRFSVLREIEIGIAPGNKIERGSATIEAILDYTGKPFKRLEKGTWATVYGWQNRHQHYYGDNLGLRWHGNCDIPDLELLPQKYPELESVTFYAGLEVSIMHNLMWLMSGLSRANIIKNWRFFKRIIVPISTLFEKMGTDKGGMFIRLYGTNHQYQPLEIIWTLVAEHGFGPNIPIVSAVILVKKILQGEIPPGASPCMAMYTLEDFDKVIEPWSIYYSTEERVM